MNGKRKLGESRDKKSSVFCVCNLSFSIQHMTLCKHDQLLVRNISYLPHVPHVLRFLLICLMVSFIIPLENTVRLREIGTPPIGTRHLDQSLRSSQKLENRNSLTWVLVAWTVCFTYPVLYRVSAESRAGEWEL